MKEDIFIVTGADFVDSTVKSTEKLLRADHILGEPAARNTAACIGYAAMEIVKKYEDGVMCVAASDHFIKDELWYMILMRKGCPQPIKVEMEGEKQTRVFERK